MQNTLILKGLSDEQLEKVKEVVASSCITAVTDDESVMVLPVDSVKLERTLERKYHNVAKENLKRSMEKVISDFVDAHAIAFKNEGVEIPSYIAVVTGQEYNDEEYYTAITDVRLYNKNKEEYRSNIEVEYNGYEEEFEYALREEISDEFDAIDVEKYLDEQLIKVE